MRFLPVITILLTALAVHPSAAGSACAPPPGFVDTPPPSIGPAEKMVAHIEEISIDRPLSTVLDSVSRTSLKEAIHQASSLPGVAGDYPLGTLSFGTTGAHRLVCLTDGSTLEEQVLAKERSGTSYRFRYIVWNYTSEKAHAIEYGIGDFYYTESSGLTHIVWTYSFRLKDHEFPGYLGPIGRYLFRVVFLDRQYAEMMRGTLQTNKQTAEQRPTAAATTSQRSR
jgi:hypothetical protein